jgi:hypothetical protein
MGLTDAGTMEVMEYLGHHSVQHSESMYLPALVGMAALLVVTVLIILRGKHEG